jgi:hypothetical protein
MRLRGSTSAQRSRLGLIALGVFDGGLIIGRVREGTVHQTARKALQ